MNKVDLSWLCCPICKTELKYSTPGWMPDAEEAFLNEYYRPIQCRDHLWFERDGIPELITPFDRPGALEEIARYDEIALTGEHHYTGLADSKPQVRAKLIREILLQAEDYDRYLNIGPGFGPLEDETANKGIKRYALDESSLMLKRLMKIHPDVKCVQAFAEALPFRDRSQPLIIADSVFQSVGDRLAFLEEIDRVLTTAGQVIITISYGWNYPRKDQGGFNIMEVGGLDHLCSFFRDRNYHLEVKFYNLLEEHWVDSKYEGTFLYLIAKKTR